jgi:uncharacterized Ntn-hydrolase superfamily protein
VVAAQPEVEALGVATKSDARSVGASILHRPNTR